MIIYPKQAELMAFDFSGIFVNLTIDSLEPIRIALESLDGGVINFFKNFDHQTLQSDYWLIYKTLDGRIELRVEQTHEDYKYHVDFFGGRVEYTSGISFKLENKKFVMP
jgi:hypothetical protein